MGPVEEEGGRSVHARRAVLGSVAEGQWEMEDRTGIR
jgi:hypothetical protein